MGKSDVIEEVLLQFTSPYLAEGETRHDEIAYSNLEVVCQIHDYCYDLIRENAELKGNEFSVTRARQKALLHISNSIECMMDLMGDLRAESEE